MITEERLSALEARIDRLLALFDRFEPLLERLLNGGGLFGKIAGGGMSSPRFTGGKHGKSGRA